MCTVHSHAQVVCSTHEQIEQDFQYTLNSVSCRTEFKQGGSNIKSLSLNSIMGYTLAMRVINLHCRPILKVHLDIDCVCTRNTTLLQAWHCKGLVADTSKVTSATYM